jgi:hypothetical protein
MTDSAAISSYQNWWITLVAFSKQKVFLVNLELFLLPSENVNSKKVNEKYNKKWKNTF